MNKKCNIISSTTLKGSLSIMSPHVQLKPELAVESLATTLLLTSIPQVGIMSSLAVIYSSPKPVTLPTSGAGVVFLAWQVNVCITIQKRQAKFKLLPVCFV